MMSFRRTLFALFVALPLAALVFFRLAPASDPLIFVPLFHFYIVTFITFSAAVISILLAFTLGDNAAPRHTLSSAAFGAVGILFFSHGISTPGALHMGFTPVVQWSAWLTLLTGGLVFLSASLIDLPRFSHRMRAPAVLWGTALLIAVYLGVAALRPDILAAIGENADPWHQLVLFGLTLVIWLLAALSFLRLWLTGGRTIDGVLAFVAFWMALASVSMHQFPLWHVSWWLYHFILLVGFLLTIFVLVREYEQARQFNLLRYFLAVSLNVSALLVLIAADLFASTAFRSLSGEMQQQALAGTADLVQEVRAGLDPASTPAEQLAAYAAALRSEEIAGFYVYDAAGRIVDEAYLIGEGSAAEDGEVGTLLPEHKFSSFSSALGNNPVSEIYTPESPPEGYTAVVSVHSIVAYTPLYGAADEAPIGVAEIVETLPGLTEATLQARVNGIRIATATMLALFGALFLVVRRGDRILADRAAELNKAYNDLRRSEAIRDDLSRMIVHDLRNPLSAITASLDLLRMTGSSTEQQIQFTNLARDASRRLSNLVDDILIVSKYEAGELELKYDDVSVPALIVGAVETFKAQSEAEEKAIRVSCPPELRARLDRQLIARVLDNLVGNALRYIDSRRGRIMITATAADQMLQVSIRDNGVGIPDVFKQSIFEKFVQVPGRQTELRKGTGLGLAFCRMVVEAHGGTIWAADSPGGGSDFIFRIPLNR